MHLQPGSTQISPSPEPTVPTQQEDLQGVILVPEYFHQADMTHLTIMIVRTFTISSLTVHRFIIASVTLAAKAVCDSYCTNSHYAKVGGLSTQELNTLEVEFLSLIEWRVAVEGTVMQRYYVNLVRQHSRFEITESVPHHLSLSNNHQDGDDDEQMNGGSQDSDGDQQNDGSVMAEQDYEEGLRDQWIPMGE
ncbi:hypothetical protein BGZ80_006979 [Entomortierella chlamydospora]|uniref:Cyclin-domain-containing protein n=1 Tax=Entomortierella chlamydospora TaxID=101097 RepID=A0A9P6N5C8_9FUNG|nr:hypothetical protein BGZ80_006979 [Entomortierella chlamydospora]